MKIDNEIKSGKRRTFISLTLWSSRQALWFPVKCLCGIVETGKTGLMRNLVHAPSTAKSLHSPAPWNQKGRGGEERKSILISGWPCGKEPGSLDAWNPLEVKLEASGQAQRSGRLLSVPEATHKAKLTMISSLLFISTVLSCFGTDAKALEKEVVIEILSVFWENHSLRNETGLVSVSLGRGLVALIGTRNTRSQRASIPIDLGWCPKSHIFWMSHCSKWCCCPACICSAYLSSPTTSGDQFQHNDNLLLRIHVFFFSGAPQACSRADRENKGTWSVKIPEATLSSWEGKSVAKSSSLPTLWLWGKSLTASQKVPKEMETWLPSVLIYPLMCLYYLFSFP